MGKTAACIKIIQILSCRDIVSTMELSEILETNPRNIKEYIKELELLGYTISSYKGKYGGYKLDKRELLPSVKLNDNERSALVLGTDFLHNCPDFLKYSEYESAMGKVMASFDSKNELTPITMVDRFPLSMDKELLLKRYSIIEDCLLTQHKCLISYVSSLNHSRQHTIHPYKLFVYNGSWFVLAWSELFNNFGYFKLNRIEEIKKTNDYFSRIKTYNEANYLDEFGMKQNGDFYNIKLQLTDLKTVMEERIYGKNQHIEVIDDHYINFSCDMQNKDMILSFVLSFGSKCRVLSPLWLVDMVKDEINKINNLY